jgi:hypothetical protein
MTIPLSPWLRITFDSITLAVAVSPSLAANTSTQWQSDGQLGYPRHGADGDKFRPERSARTASDCSTPQVLKRFLDEVVSQADALGLLSDEHFTVDGTLIEAAASLRELSSIRPEEPQASKMPVSQTANGATLHTGCCDLRTT